MGLKEQEGEKSTDIQNILQINPPMKNFNRYFLKCYGSFKVDLEMCLSDAFDLRY
jgi:hypothetical protein